MGTRLTVIVDNVAVGDWTGEWGLSHGSAWTAYETVKKACHCEQAQRADVAIRNPRPLAPLLKADSPYQGEMSRRDKRDRASCQRS